MNSLTLTVGDEESFLDYEEKVVYNFQKVLRTKDGMAHFAIMDLCAKLEDLIYYESLKQNNLSSAINVWSKSECIRYYQDKCDLVLRNMETKSMNWKKIFEENSHNPKLILQMLADENQKSYRGISNTQSLSASNNARNKSKYIDTSQNVTKSKKKNKFKVINNQQNHQVNSNNTNIYTFNEDIKFQNNSNTNNQDSSMQSDNNNATTIEDNLDPQLLLTENSFDDFGFDFSNDDEYAL